MKIKILIFIFILCNSCFINSEQNKNEGNQQYHFKIDELVSLNNLKVTFTDIFSDFHIIPLETRKECLFDRISNIKIINDTFLIFDRSSTKSIYIFSKQGQFIRKIHKLGRGPGEYINICDLDAGISDNSILIYILTDNNRINIYDSGGLFIRDIKLTDTFSSLAISSKGIFVYRSYPSRQSKDEYLIHFINFQGKIIYKYLRFSSVLSRPRIITFSPGGNFFLSENDIKFHMNYCNLVYSLKEYEIQPFINLSSEKYILNENDLKLIINSKNAFGIDLSKKGSVSVIEKLYRISNYSENSDLCFFKFLIGLDEYQMFYFFNLNKILCGKNFIDNLTFINPTLFKISEDQLIAYRHPIDIEKFKEYVRSGLVKVNPEEKIDILKISEYDNPVIILYELKR